MTGVTMERVVDKIRELEARIRALERLAEDDRTLDDIRTSITMLAESMANGPEQASASASASTSNRTQTPIKQTKQQQQQAAVGFTALTDPRFRVL